MNARITAGAMAVARPERLVTLTAVGDDWQTIRSRMKRLSYDVRKSGREWNAAWVVEPNPRGTGHHVHALQWGSFVPQRGLSRMARRRGMGQVVDIRAARDLTAASSYLLKMAASAYTLKLAREPERVAEFLVLNGGRMVHASRGYWRDVDGAALPSIDSARAAALRAAYGPPDGTGRWWLMREGVISNGSWPSSSTVSGVPA